MQVVVTLAEKDYLFGACVLYNSLVRNGFKGLFIVGYRKDPLLSSNKSFSELSKADSSVQLIELTTERHFTNYKPNFMMEIFERFPHCSSVTYIDPDIVVNGPADWILSWSNNGPSVCSDVNYWMPDNHPIRNQWLEITGLSKYHALDLYFNGGFVGVNRGCIQFLNLWMKILDDAGKSVHLNTEGDILKWRDGGRWHPFFAVDQDALNIAVMCWHQSITTLGPDMMSFSGYGQ